jgi:hypothetical protein
LELVEIPHSDFESQRTKAVENELGRDNPTSRQLYTLIADKASDELSQAVNAIKE